MPSRPEAVVLELFTNRFAGIAPPYAAAWQRER